MKQKLDQVQYWILSNITLLRKRFGASNVIYNPNSLQNILIKEFPLPNNWQQHHTRLLIVLPKGMKVFYTSPDRFYLDKGLRARNGKVPTHYFEHSGFNDLIKQKVARFSFHIETGWRPAIYCPNGSNLLHVLEGLKRGMYSAAQEVL